MTSDFTVDGSSGNTNRELARRGFALERHDTADGGTLLACIGELDLATTPAFEDALCRAEADGRAITLDLSGLDFIDSRGLAMILALDRRLRESGARLTIVRGPDAVNRIFEITGVLDRLEFVDSPAGSDGAPKRAGEHTSTRGAVRSAA
jgi:anti-sigma B factor antagonist